MSEAACSSMSLSRSNLYTAISFDAAFVAIIQFLRNPSKKKYIKNISHILYAFKQSKLLIQL